MGQGGLDARSIYKAARIVIGLDNLGFPASLILQIVRILSCKEITPVAPSTAACLTYPPPPLNACSGTLNNTVQNHHHLDHRRTVRRPCPTVLVRHLAEARRSCSPPSLEPIFAYGPYRFESREFFQTNRAAHPRRFSRSTPAFSRSTTTFARIPSLTLLAILCQSCHLPGAVVLERTSLAQPKPRHPKSSPLPHASVDVSTGPTAKPAELLPFAARRSKATRQSTTTMRMVMKMGTSRIRTSPTRSFGTFASQATR